VVEYVPYVALPEEPPASDDGVWVFDEELGEWVFHPHIPLGYTLPETGELSITIALIGAAAVLVGGGIALKGKRK